ncbi:MAG: PilZ domain-containing protein [Desulfomonile tiedjei]|uniref:PilZ domain-containing protein n=1 Tax=Desulfomonile tiedjei TaxID=2358 RepID=A0A9D6Z080_9BACT|nr:PilZ domain-containing protein [Desulfomonile tiedjei]
MTEKREISAKSFVRDVRSGMSSSDLMRKYKLSQTGFRSVLRKLIKAKLVSTAEINSRTWLAKDIGIVSGLRRFPRTEVKFPLVCCPADQPAEKGFVRDISAKGLSVEGIKALPGEAKNFRIRSSELVDSSTFEIEVKCRWTKANNDAEEEDVAGFEITSISTGAFDELEKIIKH